MNEDEKTKEEKFLEAARFKALRQALSGNMPKTELVDLEQVSKSAAKVIPFPSWPETTKGAPNSFLRGALFAAIQGKERRAMKREILASQKGSTVRFTGWQLDQADLDVWEQAVDLARHHPLGHECCFRMGAFLRSIGRSTGKSDHEWLKGSFARLAGGVVEITEGRYSYGGTFLEFYRDEDDDVYVLRLNPKIVVLYQAGWTAIDWEIRSKLRRKPLSLWLHGWLSSNAQNYPVKVETLHRLSGSTAKEVKHFKANLKKALADLELVAGIKSRFDGDLVVFERQPSPAQVRHLNGRKTGKRPKK